MTKVKICCILNQEEANLAIQYGADALGLVSAMPSGPGVIDDSKIRAIIRDIPPPISTFLLTSRTKASDIVEQHKRINSDTIQIVDRIDMNEYLKIREKLPGIRLVQVIHVIDEKSITEAVEISKYVNALLLDSGNPDLKIKELGGTGRVHNWGISHSIVEECSVPVFLAGGLSPDNIKEAINRVKPFGVDVCSGVRTSGMLDPEKLEQFISQVK